MNQDRNFTHLISAPGALRCSVRFVEHAVDVRSTSIHVLDVTISITIFLLCFVVACFFQFAVLHDAARIY